MDIDYIQVAICMCYVYIGSKLSNAIMHGAHDACRPHISCSQNFVIEIYKHACMYACIHLIIIIYSYVGTALFSYYTKQNQRSHAFLVWILMHNIYDKLYVAIYS